MPTYLLTGGAGFFGGILQKRLLDSGASVVDVDLQKDPASHPLLTSLQGDIRDGKILEQAAEGRAFDAVFHCAAMLAHDVTDERFLWGSNVDGTRSIAGREQRQCQVVARRRVVLLDRQHLPERSDRLRLLVQVDQGQPQLEARGGILGLGA